MPGLNEWLRKYAKQNQQRSLARTYLAIQMGRSEVAGYYTLIATELQSKTGVNGKARRLPAVLIANLAVDTAHQGMGLGHKLLYHAIYTAISAADSVGIAVLVVDVLDQGLFGFYERFGFVRLAGDSPRMALKANKAKQVIFDL